MYKVGSCPARFVIKCLASAKWCEGIAPRIVIHFAGKQLHLLRIIYLCAAQAMHKGGDCFAAKKEGHKARI